MSSGIVADPRNVQTRDDIHPHRHDEQTSVSTADAIDSDLYTIADDQEAECTCDKGASELVPIADPADDQKDRSCEKVNGDSEQLSVDVAVSHPTDDGRPKDQPLYAEERSFAYIKVDSPYSVTLLQN